ncbi:MAG: magnesium transporter [Gammaproteobacteria bacterium]|nr:magnesium transporter [Gammaproteobacteria bacterium]MDE0285931.1 magnesium transporter [Gammaproteobacteria bacterium]
MKGSIADISASLRQDFFQNYPAEAVHYIEELPAEQITEVLQSLPHALSVSIWEMLSPVIGARVLANLDDKSIQQVLSRIDPNRGALVLSSLSDEERRRYLALLNSHVVQDFERALSYEPNSAGALMNTRLVYYTRDMKVRDVVKKLRVHKQTGFRVLFITDDENTLTGIVELQDLVLARRENRLGDMVLPARAIARVTTSREELLDIFEKQRLTELPVVDADGHLIGIIQHHILIDAAREEAVIDMQTMVGVSKDERALSDASFAIKKRLPWLQVNLATAFLAAAVVGVFEHTIAQVTALAVLLPVVAGQSGNTGAQALAVTMRGLALREVWPRHWFRLVFKEFNVGLWNGIAVALTTALGVYIWSQSLGLCLIIGLSMVASMIIASVSGALIPILLIKAGQDPATSSSIFLTTVTDVMGFLSFLGIATLLMGMI